MVYLEGQSMMAMAVQVGCSAVVWFLERLQKVERPASPLLWVPEDSEL
jgi:hypothetical protein